MAKDIKCDTINENTADAGVTVENIVNKGGYVNLVQQVFPGAADSGYVKIGADPSNEELVIRGDSGSAKRLMSMPTGVNKNVFFPAAYDSTKGDFPVLQIATSGTGRFHFRVPDDFVTLVKLVLIGIPEELSGGSGKNIDLYSDYGGIGQSYTAHNESDTSSTYNTGTGNSLFELNISGVFNSLAAEDYCGLRVTHNSVGASISYLGIYLEYKSY